MAKGDFSRRMMEWGRGRNGSDELARACTNLAVVLVVVDLFARTSVISVLALALLFYACWRIASKNVIRRRDENRAFATKMGPALAWLVSPFAQLGEFRHYKHLTCPACGQRVRVPRGKGHVRVTCPKCHERFEGRA